MTKKSNVIFIASCSYDWDHLTPVVTLLRQAGKEVIVYEADKAARGVTHFSIALESGKGLVVNYDGYKFSLDSIAAAWYRKPHILTQHMGEDEIRMTAIIEEIKRLQDGLFQLIPTTKWLNPPDEIKSSAYKVSQLARAEKLGIRIPTTLITNKSEDIAQQFPLESEIIFKPTQSRVRTNKSWKFLNTTILTNDANIPKLGNPFPGIWQEFAQKKREWRITVVGDKIFSASIYTTEHARNDWRIHQGGPHVQFKAELFPIDLQEKCLEFLAEAGLRFGVFDFVENEQGNVIFLELNPNGQYLWLEEELGLEISAAIADQLLSTANTK